MRSLISGRWFGDYEKLEYKHGYIQWLYVPFPPYYRYSSDLLVTCDDFRFPIREYGMNYESQPLYKHEIERMKADPVIIQRVIRARPNGIQISKHKMASLSNSKTADLNPTFSRLVVVRSFMIQQDSRVSSW